MILDLSKIQMTMARNGFTTAAVSKRYGCTRERLAVIFRRVNAGQQIRPTTAGKLANALDVDVSEIIKA